MILEPQTEIQNEEEIQIEDDEHEKPIKSQPKKTDKELEEDDEDLDGTNDDDIIDELVQEYQKIKKAYENRRVHNRRKR